MSPTRQRARNGFPSLARRAHDYSQTGTQTGTCRQTLRVTQ